MANFLNLSNTVLLITGILVAALGAIVAAVIVFFLSALIEALR
jgi:NAD/NADP transhydrogenase beta subunit